MKNKLEKIDNILLLDCLILLFLGFIMIYSSSSVIGYEKFSDSMFFVKKQVVLAIIGVILAIFIFKQSVKNIKKYIPLFLIASIILLFMVYIPGFGKKVGGAKRWIKFLFFPSFQPFEMVKLVYVIYVAKVLTDEKLKSFRKLLKLTILTGIICCGLIFQPDLGGAFIIIS